MESWEDNTHMHGGSEFNAIIQMKTSLYGVWMSYITTLEFESTATVR